MPRMGTSSSYVPSAVNRDAEYVESLPRDDLPLTVVTAVWPLLLLFA